MYSNSLLVLQNESCDNNVIMSCDVFHHASCSYTQTFPICLFSFILHSTFVANKWIVRCITGAKVLEIGCVKGAQRCTGSGPRGFSILSLYSACLVCQLIKKIIKKERKEKNPSWPSIWLVCSLNCGLLDRDSWWCSWNHSSQCSIYHWHTTVTFIPASFNPWHFFFLSISCFWCCCCLKLLYLSNAVFISGLSTTEMSGSLAISSSLVWIYKSHRMMTDSFWKFTELASWIWMER